MIVAAVFVGVLAGAAATLLLVRRRYLLVTVDGTSMLPTLRAGDRVLVRRGTAALRAGRLVVAGWPREPGATGDPLMVKRVAALPGDPAPAVLPEAAGTLVPAGRVVLLGDNQQASRDSRQHGYFALADVRGVVVRHFTGPRR
ncbi:S26 family signal peptidase [Catellatospora vulcania]|uniref:S26 family signal peptidase n=1 Tax=Catellatospora vulcania TaxID=1460450 RepID=UPI001E2C5B0A|nr:S26 family signal peptidase [Catellatospora vulcania]